MFLWILKMLESRGHFKILTSHTISMFMLGVRLSLWRAVTGEMKLWARLALLSITWAEVVLDRPDSQYKAPVPVFGPCGKSGTWWRLFENF
jgi:hypothetical protein